MTPDIRHGDCLEVLRTLPDNSVDSVVTDPPYGLEFMGKDWDSFRYSNSGPQHTDFKNLGALPSFSPNRRNQKCPDCNKWAYDHPGRKCECGGWKQPAQLGYSNAFHAWCALWAAECLRVLKPGGHLLAFGGTRTYHRLACAIEDAGFEIRDSITWLYGSGFPKSLDVSKAIDKAAGEEREVLATIPVRWAGKGSVLQRATQAEAESVNITAPATPDAEKWQGWGTALKPASEPIVVARKPLAGTVAANVLAHGTGGINVDACRVGAGKDIASAGGTRRSGGIMGASEPLGGWEPTPRQGRWPANVVLTHVGSVYYTLRHDAPESVRTYYGDREALREVSGPDSGNALGDSAPEVLLAGMRERGAEGSPEDRVGVDALPCVRGDIRDVPGVGAQRTAEVLRIAVQGEGERAEQEPSGEGAQSGVAGENVGWEDGSGRRSAVVSVEGGSVSQQGVCLRDGRPVAGGDAGVGSADGEGQVRRRTPGRGSGVSWSSADGGRRCTSHQRGEDGQPTGEPCGDTSGGSHEGAPRVRAKVPAVADRGGESAGGECGVALPLDLIPLPWLRYFDGPFEAPGCEQTGERRVRSSNAGPSSGGFGGGMFGDGTADLIGGGHADADGTETVPAFDCAPGCPVAELDQQSGTSSSTTADRGLPGGTFRLHGFSTADELREAAERDGLCPDGRSARETFRRFLASADHNNTRGHADSGGASRFFPTFRYQAKAPTSERPKVDGSPAHPTVKPLALMRWLVRLVTPPGGTVLEPFAGSGTNVVADILVGFHFIAIYREADYLPFIQARVERAQRQQTEPQVRPRRKAPAPQSVSLPSLFDENAA